MTHITDINNVIKYEGNSIQEFFKLVSPFNKYLNSLNPNGYSGMHFNLRWQHIHGEPCNDRLEIDEAIEFIKTTIGYS